LRRAVLFDFDGTLIDTWRLYLEAFRRALEPHFGRRLTDREILDLKPTAERRLLERVVDAERFAGSFRLFLSHYEALHDSHCDGLYPGVASMLDELRANGWLIGIVTGKSRAAWTTTCTKASLAPFDVVITDDDVFHPKPHAEGLIAAMEKLNVFACETCYIGDSLLDAQAAQEAGMAFGAAFWSKPVDEHATFRLGLRGIHHYELHAPKEVVESLRARTGGSTVS